MQSIITSMRYHTHCNTFSLSLAWFGGYLERGTMRYRQISSKMYVNIF